MKQHEYRIKIIVVTLFLLLASVISSVYTFQQKAVASDQEPASAWASRDIGAVGRHGAVSVKGTTFTIQGPGKDIWESSDHFRYVYYVLPANGQLVAQILSQGASDRWAKAGIMVRETLADNAVNIMMAMTPHYGITFQRRLVPGGQTSHKLTRYIKVPRWMKLVRQDSRITGWASTNGVKWVLVNSMLIKMRKSVYMGLAVTSHNNRRLSRVVFAHVRFSINEPPPIIVPTPTPTQVPLSLGGIQVYGQGDSFTTNDRNKGGISPRSLASPIGVVVDNHIVDNHRGLYVSDYGNNRVLYYPAGSTTATRVYGQAGSFSTATPNNGGVNASSLAGPIEVALDSSGGLYVADYSNNRVLYYPSGSTTATRVYGQGNTFSTATRNNRGVSAASLAGPAGMVVDSHGGLYVADYGNNRVLYYPAGSTTATRVYGQRDSFTTTLVNNGGVSAGGLAGPIEVTVDSSGDLYVSDYGNNRVLYYPAGSTTATRVYGQGGSFTTNIANNGGISADSLDTPMGVTLDSNDNLYVADYSNNRVLYYPVGSTTATWVYGQGGFDTATGNSGGTSANSLYLPWGIALDGGDNLYVGDYNNNRVLIFQRYIV